MTAVVRHREANKRSFAAKGVALTYTPYFVAAIVAGLQAPCPRPTAASPTTVSWSTGASTWASPWRLAHGLLVPVIRDADEKNLQGLARLVNDLVERTRANSAAAGRGSGRHLHADQSRHRRQPLGHAHHQPAADGHPGRGRHRQAAGGAQQSSASLLPNADDSIVIRPMCYLSLTFDHRVLDGAQARCVLDSSQAETRELGVNLYL